MVGSCKMHKMAAGNAGCMRIVAKQTQSDSGRNEYSRSGVSADGNMHCSQLRGPVCHDI